MEQWSRRIYEEHRNLEAQVALLKSVLEIDVNPEDRRITLRSVLETVVPVLELHLRREEAVLFPRLAQVLGREAMAVRQMLLQHAELRSAMSRLKQVLAGPAGFNQRRLTEACGYFVDLWMDHEEKEERFLLEALEVNLNPSQLGALGKDLG